MQIIDTLEQNRYVITYLITDIKDYLHNSMFHCEQPHGSQENEVKPPGLMVATSGIWHRNTWCYDIILRRSLANQNPGKIQHWA